MAAGTEMVRIPEPSHREEEGGSGECLSHAPKYTNKLGGASPTETSAVCCWWSSSAGAGSSLGAERGE
eukprot:2874089-Amphidinium_carterae.1